MNILNEHMKRSLGVLTDWDTFKKGLDAAAAREAHGSQTAANPDAQETVKDKEAVPVHAHKALPHSREDESGHKAVHAKDVKKDHDEHDPIHMHS